MGIIATKRIAGHLYNLLFFNAALLWTSVGWSQGQQTIYSYNIGVEQSDKAALSLATDELSVTDRLLLQDGFRFKSEVVYSEEFITAHFAAKGVEVTTFERTKGPGTVAALQKIGGNNCEQAEQLCSGASLSGGTSGFGTQELGPSNRGCLTGNEHQSSWYYLNILTGGTLTFTINPAVNSDDYDFAVWGPYTAANAGANCPPVVGPIRCSFYNNGNGLGNTGLAGTAATQGTSEDALLDNNLSGADGFVQQLNVLANEVYILLIDNFSISMNPYDLSFGGTAVLGCTPIVLPVELSGFTGVCTTEGNLLSWTTQSESAASHFRIEWTDRPQSAAWQSIGNHEATGDTDQASFYYFLDRQLRSGLNYYRLVQVDNNGMEHVYNDYMIVIDNSSDKPQRVRVLNLLGQEVSKDEKGLLLFQFEDGYSLKIFRE